MTSYALLRRSLKHYRLSNLAVIAGVATAVAVLAGAMLVGDSVKASLRRIALGRLGNTGSYLKSSTVMRQDLAKDIGGAPLLMLDGLVTHQSNRRRATQISVYGVNASFWEFHSRVAPGLTGGEGAISEDLANELGAKSGDTLLLRIQRHSDIPAETLYGRKEDAHATLRLTIKLVLDQQSFGEFTLQANQGPVRSVFVPLDRLQREVAAEDRVNIVLLRSGAVPKTLLKSKFQLDDLGIRVHEISADAGFQLDTTSGILEDSIVAAADRAATQITAKRLPVLTYLATTISAGSKSIPYSLVAATNLSAFNVKAGANAVVLNEWAARELSAKPGDAVEMEYLVWADDGSTRSEKASFEVAAIVPISGLAADQKLTPDYPGITDTDNLSDWDPPFPLDLKRIRKVDEDYWHDYRTTPKAWLAIETGQRLWGSRFGKISAIRYTNTTPESLDDFRKLLHNALDPETAGLTLVPIRAMSEVASRGSTDFGEYFIYFSFFLVAAALLLAGLFFRLSVEQRSKEVGLLEAVGFTTARIRRQFMLEAGVLALAGAALGTAGAIVYAWFIITGLGSWWSGAVGTRNLTLTISIMPLVKGVAGGVVASLVATLIALNALKKVSARQLLAGGQREDSVSFRSRAWLIAVVSFVVGIALLAASATGAIPAAGGFFGAGSCILIAGLAFLRTLLTRSVGQLISGNGPRAFAKLSFRNAAWKPGRTVLSAALIASATFLIVSLEAFRRDPNQVAGDYPLIAESVRPIFHNPNTAEGREQLNIPDMPSVKWTSFRLRPGDDASCLNLYQPSNPRILGAPAKFFPQLESAATDSEAIPAIADMNSMMYVLHKAVGDEMVLPNGTRLKFVAALHDSVFQSEVIIREADFLRAFPREQGYKVFLLQAPAKDLAAITSTLEDALSDQGLDITSTAERLAAYHRVENTYLSTFQALGGLGLLLGTVGLAAVLYRNVVERGRELAILLATGYLASDIRRLVLGENLFILVSGLAIGSIAAGLAILPVLQSRGSAVNLAPILLLLAAVAITGLLSTLAAASVALRRPLVGTLRAG